MKSTALVVCLVSLAIVLGLAVPSQAAYEFYMSVKGSKQGQFKAENTKVPNGLTCLGLQLEAESQRDTASSLPTGRRQYTPVTITRQWGAASPLLFEAFATNELLPEVVISFPQVNANGTTFILNTIKLTNAMISRLEYHVEPAAQQPALMHLLEEVSFSFQKIEVTNVDGGVTAGDTVGAGAALAPGHLFLPGTLAH